MVHSDALMNVCRAMEREIMGGLYPPTGSSGKLADCNRPAPHGNLQAAMRYQNEVAKLSKGDDFLRDMGEKFGVSESDLKKCAKVMRQQDLADAQKYMSERMRHYGKMMFK